MGGGQANGVGGDRAVVSGGQAGGVVGTGRCGGAGLTPG